LFTYSRSGFFNYKKSIEFYKTFLLFFLILVDGKIRRRRQYLHNNYGSYVIDPPVYGTSGGGSYTGNNQNNRFIVGGVAYQYPTPVNVMSGGSYNPQQYNAYPAGSDGYYYRKSIKDIL
jgi:hypothetical protein